MPNWCVNTIKVTEGERGSLKRFKKTLNSYDHRGRVVPFSFHQTVPIPEDEDEEWMKENWGTTLDPIVFKIDEGAEDITISIMTPWSPPKAWLANTVISFNVKINCLYKVRDVDESGSLHYQMV